MNYRETLDFLFDQLPMYQRVGKAAYKADLVNTFALLKALGNPENKFKSIHIGGTNGKGSTSHILASVFHEAGYKTGLYTSPHLLDFRERIKINGKPISKRKVIDFVENVKLVIHQINPSFFELTVGMAFDYFANQNVDIAIVEVGLGGRLDSTNVIEPEVSVITNIGFDHTQFLGNTIASIAREKAGIIKKNAPLITATDNKEVETIFKSIASRLNAPVYSIFDYSFIDYKNDLKGNYQQLNVKTALLALQILKEKGWSIPEESIRKGLSNVIANTGFRGRWEVLAKSPKVICDTGHNVDGIVQIVQQLKIEKYKQLHFVFGMVNDKDPGIILSLLPKNANYYFCRSSVPRSLPVEKLILESNNAGLKGNAFSTVESAFLNAMENAKENDLIFVGGSTFVVADLLSYLEKIKK